jgi:hypothetical protein
LARDYRPADKSGFGGRGQKSLALHESIWDHYEVAVNLDDSVNND